MTPRQPHLAEWQERARGEFTESPGLRLTRGEAKRLWVLGERECQEVLDALVASGFLRRTKDGAYIRDLSH